MSSTSSRISSALIPIGIGKLPFTFAAEMLVELDVYPAFNLLAPSSVDDDLLTFATETLSELSTYLSV
jgi:hypothetical protein